jgi:hypothetical protein
MARKRSALTNGLLLPEREVCVFHHWSQVVWMVGRAMSPDLKVKDIWAIRVRLQIQVRTHDLALFDLGIDSKLRGCDLVKLRVRDVGHGDR